MRRLLIHAALFLGLLLSLSPPMRGAALTNASMQGSYFFALHKVDASVLGFSFTNAVGTLRFDGNGGITVDGSINRNSAVQPLSASGTYTLDSAGSLQLSIPALPLTVGGSVSFDLNSFLTSNVTSSNLQSQEVLLGTKQPAAPFSPALLTGKYFLSQRTITAVGVSPRFENSTGTVNFDGAGNCTLELTSNRSGSITGATTSGTYQVTSGGNVLLSLAVRSDPVTLGFAPEGSLGVGATVAAGSSNTYDTFVLTKADSAGLGNAGLGGSYQVMVGAVNVNIGFSTSAGRVVYPGDGRVSYQLRQNRMGAAANVTGDSTISVTGSGSLQFSGVQNLTGVFQGGLGSQGHSLVAASVNDTSVYNFLIAIRTPSLAAATTNGASFSTAAALSPGALFSLFGTNLARQTVQASSLPLPRQMGGASVRMGGIEAPLLFVSPFQINAQVPFELPPGPAQITVVLDGVESGPLAAAVNAAGPGVFTLSRDGNGAGIFLHGEDFSLVSQSSPARPGEVILIYGTGLGAVLPSAPSGAGAPSSPLASAVSPVTVLIGGRDSEVRFAGLAPDFVGLYQINVRVPPDVVPGSSVSVLVIAGGAPSNTVTLPVAP